MEINRENDCIIIKNENEILEKYNFDEEISFKKLIEYLLSLKLDKKIELSVKIDDLKENEDNLVKLIKEIINDYNESVTDFAKFIEDREKNQ